jgi:hypothetical protein
MITSNTFYPFGGKVATIETPAFVCMVSTAKEGLFQKQSVRISDCANGVSNRRVVAKFLYNPVLSKQDRLGLHDAVVASIDELGMSGYSLKDALQNLFERLKEEGIGSGIIED